MTAAMRRAPAALIAAVAAVSALVTSAAVSATAQVPTVIYIGYVRTGIAGGPGRRARPAGAEAPRRRRRQ